MSFARDLEGHVELVQKHAVTRCTRLEEFMQLVRERAMYEDLYAQGLEKISKHELVAACQGEFARLATSMKEECAVRADAARKLSSSIMEEIVNPLRSMLSAHFQDMKGLAVRLHSSQKKLLSLHAALEAALHRYHSQFRKCEDLAVKLDTCKSLSEKRRAMGPHTADGIVKSMQGALADYKDRLKAYNDFLPMHKETVRESLQRYQTLEEERLVKMGQSTKRLWVVGISAIEVVLDDAKSRAGVSCTQEYSDFFPQYDIAEFITESRELPGAEVPATMSFHPYSGTHPAFFSLGDCLPVLSLPANDSLKLDSDEHISAPLDASKKRLERLMTQAWGEILTSQELGEVREIVKSQRGRRLWVSFMNARRAEGKFRLGYQGFCSVAEIMNVVLDECGRNADIATSKSCIILSQTFHHMKGAEKEFLQSKITSHSLWRSESVWDAIVKDGIEGEVAKREECGGEQASLDRSSLVFSQLSSFAYVMSLFGVQADVSRTVLQRHCSHYQFSPEETNMLVGLSSAESSPVLAETRSQSSDCISGTCRHSRHFSLSETNP